MAKRSFNSSPGEKNTVGCAKANRLAHTYVLQREGSGLHLLAGRVLAPGMLLVGESGAFLPLLIIKHPLPCSAAEVLETGVAPVPPGPVTGATWGLSESLALPFLLPQDRGALGLQPLVVPTTPGAPPQEFSGPYL